ncbi:hypothetical protein Btru_031119 [Bulinus truncatus]|nr:hypothetical protein Btru_031119 [Bulinus truncatus]
MAADVQWLSMCDGCRCVMAVGVQWLSVCNGCRCAMAAGNGYIEGSELDRFLYELVTSVNTQDVGPEAALPKMVEFWLFGVVMPVKVIWCSHASQKVVRVVMPQKLVYAACHIGSKIQTPGDGEYNADRQQSLGRPCG